MAQFNASSDWLIRGFHAHPPRSYEYCTAMLWMNICAQYFPLHTNDYFLYAPEFSRAGGRCDLVIAQYLTRNNPVTGAFEERSFPFFALEFKSCTRTANEWTNAFNQMRSTMQSISDRNQTTWIYGCRSDGIVTEFYYWDRTLVPAQPTLLTGVGQNGTTNFNVGGNDTQQADWYLQLIHQNRPALVQVWP